MTVALATAALRRSMLPLMGISVAAWVAFAVCFRALWPGPTAAGDAIALVFAWLVVAGGAFLVTVFAIFRWFQIPPAWRSSAAIALSAPALCLDVFTMLFFEPEPSRR